MFCHHRLPTDHMLSLNSELPSQDQNEDGFPDQIRQKGEDLNLNESNTYSNASDLWYPLWAKGLYGGAIIAQSLNAAHNTVPLEFLVHSMHCHFLRPAQHGKKIYYKVERTRDGRGFMIRIVKAFQEKKLIFHSILSFNTSHNGNAELLEHQVPMPLIKGVQPPTGSGEEVDEQLLTATCQAVDGSLFECVRIPDTPRDPEPTSRRLRQWVRVRDRTHVYDNETPLKATSSVLQSNIQSHLIALAYLTDNYFIGTTSRVHGASRFSAPGFLPTTLKLLHNKGCVSDQKLRNVQRLVYEEAVENAPTSTLSSCTAEPKNVSTLLTLDHTIYFHNQQQVRANEWMLTEVETPWAGDQRGLVLQRVWNQDGVLVATCFQEGVVRIESDEKTTDVRVSKI